MAPTPFYSRCALCRNYCCTVHIHNVHGFVNTARCIVGGISQTRVSNDCLSLVSEAGKMLGGAGTAHPTFDARRPRADLHIRIRKRHPPLAVRCSLFAAHRSSLFTRQKRTRLPQDRRSPAGRYNESDQGPFAAPRPPTSPWLDGITRNPSEIMGFACVTDRLAR